MSEAVYRSGRKKGFVILMRDAAQDTRLSLEARGLFTMMVSLPDNWEYTVSGLALKAGCGKDKIRRLLNELQKVGYLIREQSHDKSGKFSGNIYLLQDEVPLSENPDNGEQKQNSPLSENTVVGEHRCREIPLTGFTTQKNKDINIPPYSPPTSGGTGTEKKKRKYDLDEEAKATLRDYVGQDRELAKALGAFIDIRIKLRAVHSQHAVKLLLGKLDSLSNGDRQMKLQLIAQSVENSWKGLFPLKGCREQKKQTTPTNLYQPKILPVRPHHFEVIEGEERIVYDDC